jgi:hypothetical protein
VDEVLGRSRVVEAVTKNVLETALNEEMTDPLIDHVDCWCRACRGMGPGVF